MGEQLWLTPREVADLLRKPEGTLRQWRHRKYGPPSTKVGLNVRYNRKLLDKWLDSQTREAA